MLILLSLLLAAILPDFSYYHTAQHILATIQSLPTDSANAHYFSLESCTPPLNEPNEPIHIVKFTDSRSKLSQIASKKLKVLINAGEHGRELITSEIALNFLETLANPGAEHADLVNYIARNVELTVIPLLNSWSHRAVEEGAICTRKNRNSVDLNRNYQQHWNRNGANSEQYSGPKPFSEWESRCLADFVHNSPFFPSLYINLHSGIKEMYYGYDDEVRKLPNTAEADRLLRFINDLHCGCKQGIAAEIGGYPVYGGSMDYIYNLNSRDSEERERKPRNSTEIPLLTAYSYTLEVYGDSSKPMSDCFAFFNPITRESYNSTVENWKNSLFSMIFGLIQEKLAIPFLFSLPKHLERGQSSANYHDKWQIQAKLALKYEISYTRQQNLPFFTVNNSEKSRILLVSGANWQDFFSPTLISNYFIDFHAEISKIPMNFMVLPTVLPDFYSYCSVFMAKTAQNSVEKAESAAEREISILSRQFSPDFVVEFNVNYGILVNSTQKSSNLPDFLSKTTMESLAQRGITLDYAEIGGSRVISLIFRAKSLNLPFVLSPGADDRVPVTAYRQIPGENSEGSCQDALIPREIQGFQSVFTQFLQELAQFELNRVGKLQLSAESKELNSNISPSKQKNSLNEPRYPPAQEGAIFTEVNYIFYGFFAIFVFVVALFLLAARLRAQRIECFRYLKKYYKRKSNMKAAAVDYL
jgi:hypothetical protein